MADNFLDIGHIPWLHVASFADPDDTTIPKLSPQRCDHGFSVTHRHRTQRLHGAGTGRRVMTIRYTAPFSVVMRLEYLDDDAVITAAFFMQPIDAERSRLFAVNWRNDILDGRCSREETVAFQQMVGEEDRRLLERIRSKWIPLDLRAEVHTRADATTVEMRRTLARLLAA
jgi:vanillate O-demethylase monooxygenase subunit